MSTRRTVALALALAVPVTLAGGTLYLRHFHPREVQPMQMHKPGLDLRCQVEVSGSKVRVRYSVTNQSAEEVYLYDDGVTQRPHLVCDAGDGAVNVLLGISPLPPKRSFVWKFHPEATRLGPGQRKDGELSLDLPLREWNSYDNDDYLSLRSIHTDRLRLLLDYVRPSSAGFTPPPGPLGTPECAVCEVPVDLVLDRRDDDFERRGSVVR